MTTQAAPESSAVGRAGTAEELQQLRHTEKLRRELGGLVLGALEGAEPIEDVCLNPDGQLWANGPGSGWRRLGCLSASAALAALGTIAAIKGTVINHANPVLETELPLDGGSRFEGLVPPVVAAPTFAIRTRPRRVFSLEDYIESEILTTCDDPRNRPRARASFRESVHGLRHAEILVAAIRARRNVLVVGSTGSGKTTLANTCLDLVRRYTPEDRIISIEDTYELRNPVENSVELRAVGSVTMQECLRAALRLKPKRIVVGEVRGREALVLLKSWNTGHPGGIATIHANDAVSGLTRLESLVGEGTEAPQHDLIGSAVDVVVFIDEDGALPAGRKVREVMLVDGWKDGAYECAYV